jgi:formylglycine-generating enzyme required for sulfatase activity
MSDQLHSSKFQDVLARMKAAKTASDETSQSETSTMRVSVDSIAASTIQKPRDIATTPVHFFSVKKETVASVNDEASSIEAETLEKRQKPTDRVSQLQSQIDSLLGTDDKTVTRIQRKGQNVINQILADMIYVEGGTFMMGHDEQWSESMESYSPVHQVTLSSFYMCKRPLLREDWEILLEETVRDDGKPHTIFANIDEGRLNDVDVLCNRLSKITGCHFRLQTEAEHEYAARGGRKSKGGDYAGSNQLELIPQLSSKPKANELGFTYMNYACRFRPEYHYMRVHGIAEWCSDYFGPYSAESQVNPQGPSNGTKHVFRSSDTPVWVRNYGRNRLLGTWREADWCIRLVCEDTPKARVAIQRAKEA